MFQVKDSYWSVSVCVGLMTVVLQYSEKIKFTMLAFMLTKLCQQGITGPSRIFDQASIVLMHSYMQIRVQAWHTLIHSPQPDNLSKKSSITPPPPLFFSCSLSLALSVFSLVYLRDKGSFGSLFQTSKNAVACNWFPQYSRRHTERSVIIRTPSRSILYIYYFILFFNPCPV